MQCPHCQSTHLQKNGRTSGKQRYRCKDCRRSFTLPQSLNSVSISSNGYKPLHGDRAEESSQDNISQALQTTLESLISPELIETVVNAPQIVSTSNSGVAVLLLDAENLSKFDPKAESFLRSLSTYPLQIKIAFANWKNTSGDTELYERGYQLMHVPLGKNSADAQMLSMGAAICRHYPDAKEVFVCSSDWLLTHLCNELQNQGLVVYRVRKEDEILTVENRTTGEKQYYSLSYNVKIPNWEEFVQKIGELIQAEQDSLANRLSRLAIITKLFQQRIQIQQFQHQSNLSDRTSQAENLSEDALEIKCDRPLTTIQINSRADLEQALIEILYKLTASSPGSYINISRLSSEFHQHYGFTYKEAMTQLSLKTKFLTFLQACSAFSVKKVGTVYEVSLVTPNPLLNL